MNLIIYLTSIGLECKSCDIDIFSDKNISTAACRYICRWIIETSRISSFAGSILNL